MNRTLFSLSLATALCAGGAAGWFLRGTYEVQGKATLSASAPVPPPPAQPAAIASVTITPPPAADPKPASPTETARQATDLSNVPAGERLTTDLAFALEEGAMTAEFRGNGRDRLRMVVVNRAPQPVRLSIPAGQAFEGTHGIVIIPRAQLFDFAPGETRLEDLLTIPTASTNQVDDRALALSSDTEPKLQGLLDYLAEHPEVSLPAAQTAALAILENLPANAFANFTQAGSDLPSPWNTAAFKVEVADLVRALIVLRQIGIPDEQLAITVDPQTKIEAMIDPLARALAMQYYGIKPDAEWAYWKHELLEGEPSTRHYALHGIARYYPEIAIPMLPGWARESRTSPVFRRTAIQALAETQRAEALSALKALEQELSEEADLSKAARDAASYLEASLNRAAAEIRPVGFRMTKNDGSTSAAGQADTLQLR